MEACVENVQVDARFRRRYPSEEDDIKDPRERDRAMKEAVGDVLDMARRSDVINQAYDLIEN